MKKIKSFIRLLSLALFSLLGLTIISCEEITDSPSYESSSPTSEPIHTHEWDVGEITKKATCTDEGQITYSCTSCDEVKFETIAALGHNEVIDAGKEATCTETGLTEGKRCDRCNEVLVQQEEISSLGHTFADWTITKKPTCDDTGTKRRECNNCDHYEEETIEAIGHDYESVVTNPTCEEKGYTTYTCENCNNSYVDNYVDELGHVEVVDAGKEATCTETGQTEGKHCDRCNEVLVKQKEIPALDHNYGILINEIHATCTQTGIIAHYHCDRCEKDFDIDKKEVVDLTIPLKEHEFNYSTYHYDATGHWFECNNCNERTNYYNHIPNIEQPTETDDMICIICDYVIQEALGHTHVMQYTKEVEATCETNGNIAYYQCSGCKKYYSDKNGKNEIKDVRDLTISSFGHNYGELVLEVSATCLNEGTVAHYHCDRCNKYFNTDKEEINDLVIKALGHNGVIDEKADATCETTGLTEGSHCDRCGEVLVEQEVIPALGHDYDSVVTEPTCEEEGYTTHTCSRCDDSYVDSYVSATGHSLSEWNVTLEPGCESVGTKRRDCANCDHYEEEEIVALGHDVVVDKTEAATCTETGLTEGSHCDRCNKVLVEQELVPSLGHDYDSVVTEPTCEEEGYTTHTCSRCDNSYVDSYVNALGHSFGDWEVTNEPGCESVGTKHRDCVSCDHYEEEEIAALGHVEVIDKAIAPTCTETGLTEGKHCDRCNEILVKQEEVSSLSHNYNRGICIYCNHTVLGSSWIAPDFTYGDYSMVIIPDTQNMVSYHSSLYYDMMQWIVDNEDNFNIKAAMHMGDLVNNNTSKEWEICKTGMNILNDSNIPWMPMRGNHDDSTWFNKYYDYETYGTNRNWFGGSYQEGKLDHCYWYVTVGTREYLILSLGWAPSWDVLNWACDVVEENKDKNIIINCHAYMNSDNTLLSKGDSHCPSSYLPGYPNGDDIWNSFKKYQNVVLAMGGHISSPDINKYVDINGNLQDVYSLLVDNQNEDTSKGLGMILLLTFNEDNNVVNLNWYSTKYDALYGQENQYAINVPHISDNQGLEKIDISDLFNNWTSGGPVLYATGLGYGEKGYTSGSNYNLKYSDFVRIDDYEMLELTICGRSGYSATGGFAFYEEANVESFISYGKDSRNGNGMSNDKTIIRTVQVPDNAKYIRVTYWSEKSSNSSHKFSCIGYKNSDRCEHNLTLLSKEPTCEEQGYNYYYCNKCSLEYIVEYLDKLEHDFKEVEVPATCTDSGYINLICNLCGHEEVKQHLIDISDLFNFTDKKMIIATNGSDSPYDYWIASDYTDISIYQKLIIKTADTIYSTTTTGLAFYDKNKAYISGYTHTTGSGVYGVIFREIEIPSNAVYIRTTWYSKTHPNYSEDFGNFYCHAYVPYYIEPLDHSYGDWVVTNEPECESSGVKRKVCTYCDHYEEEEIPALGHDEVIDEAVEPEYDKHGLSEGIHCDRCNTVLQEQIEIEPEIQKMNLRYDDHIDISNNAVKIINEGNPTSYKVGYNVNNEKDDQVISIEDNYLVATGIGNAVVQIDNIFYEISVEAAPISLILLIGQSNMRGSEGNPDQSIICPNGMVYSTYGDDRGDAEGILNVSSARKFVPSALSGEYSLINVEGTTEHIGYYPVNSLTKEGKGKFGPDSGFAYEWVKQTNEKIWVVNAAHGGSSINSWQPNATNYKEAVLMFKACQETLQKEIDAGHFTLSHMGYFWCQGCSDSTQSAEWYVKKYLTMHNSLKEELAFDHDSNSLTSDYKFEFGGIIPILHGLNSYRQGEYKYNTNYSHYISYKTLTFTGPRAAQYLLGNSKEYEDIWVVCNAGDSWMTLPDGTNGVKEYFNKYYPNGRVDYETQVTQKDSFYAPTKSADVHDTIHYNQIGYNEIGRESVRNALIMLGEITAPNVETKVDFYSWDGYTKVSEIEASKSVNSNTLIVPIVYPLWEAKDVEYILSDGLNYDYYDLTSDSYFTYGKLTTNIISSPEVLISPSSLNDYEFRFEEDSFISVGEIENTVTKLASKLENGYFIDSRYKFNKPLLLVHDEKWILEFKMSGTWSDDASSSSKKILCEDGASSTVGSYCLLVNGEKGYLSIGSFTGSTHESYGVNLNDFNIDISLPHIYRLVNIINEDGSNTIYLFVDGEMIAPMDTYFTSEKGDTNTTSNGLSGIDFGFNYMGTPNYLLDNGIINYISLVSSNASINVHFHDWSDWKEVSLPSMEGPGENVRECLKCGLKEYEVINSIWQTTEILDHFTPLPEEFCSDINLWEVLPHDPMYYLVSSNKWGYHSSKNVPSITIPIEPGDKIYATSFGKAGENGHATANGIRVTFFGIDGIIKTTDPTGTYKEFSNNGGYIIAPEGAIAVNIPLWNNNDDNEIYILNKEHNLIDTIIDPTCTDEGYTLHECTICDYSFIDAYKEVIEHTYESMYCSACNSPHPNLENFEGKIISIMSASTSTFDGYIPVADGFNLAHRPRYPQDNLFTDVNHTWWMQLINDFDAKLGINESWAGSSISNISDTNKGDIGPDAAMASITRIKNLGSNGTPDVILFYGGRNDVTKNYTIGTFDPSKSPMEVDLETYKWDSVVEAFECAILRIKYFYPNSELVIMLPNYNTNKSSSPKLDNLNNELEKVCIYYNVKYLDLRDLTEITSHLPDGSHPDEIGMDMITNLVEKTLLEEVKLEKGENVVYNVQHTLTNSKAELHYYKGVSKNSTFIEKITGDEVTVIMDGLDVTEQCYQKGIISIMNITGNIIITITSKFDADGHLQQLPENVCADTNIWKILKHENLYYTANGWDLLDTNPSVHSVTFNVNPGENIWATSFLEKGTNGLSSNGTRITWFNELGVFQSIDRNTVYNEFINNGYVIVPEGAIAVNIPMGNNNDNNEIYILNKEHIYEDNKCLACGKIYQKFENKVISILGDSISTFKGEVPTGSSVYYPKNDVTTVNDTWWHQFISLSNAKLGINDSWGGTQVYNPSSSSNSMISAKRINNLSTNGTPDYILFFGGTNDIAYRDNSKRGLPLGEFDETNISTTADWSKNNWSTYADAYLETILRLQDKYPDAEIIVILPHHNNYYYTDEVLNDYKEVMIDICECFDVLYVDLDALGFDGSTMLIDVTHPNAKGMDFIAEAIYKTVSQ